MSSGFFFPCAKKKKKKCLFLVVKLKYLSLLMLLSEASWAAESHTQRLLWIAIECPHKAEHPWPPGPGPFCLVCVREGLGAGGGRRWQRWDKSFLTEGRGVFLLFRTQLSAAGSEKTVSSTPGLGKWRRGRLEEFVSASTIANGDGGDNICDI